MQTWWSELSSLNQGVYALAFFFTVLIFTILAAQNRHHGQDRQSFSSHINAGQKGESQRNHCNTYQLSKIKNRCDSQPHWA